MDSLYIMKKVSIVVPTFNEQDNIIPLYQELVKIMKLELSNYDYEIIFIDNYSLDNTRSEIRKLCSEDVKVKAVFNAKNFGAYNSQVYGMCQSTGDCTIMMCADFQEPPEMIPKFIAEWENSYPVVIGIKTSSKESFIMYTLRSIYYKTIRKMSNIEQIEHFTGFGLYDASFVDTVRKLNDPIPFLRGIVAELAGKIKKIPYQQEKRRSGISSCNWYNLYDAAMLSFTAYTKIGLRLATFLGFVFSVLSFFVACFYFVLKLIYWDSFAMGMAALIIGLFMFSSIQMLFIGFLGEYIMNMNTRIMNRPLIIEEERINFIDDSK